MCRNGNMDIGVDVGMVVYRSVSVGDVCAGKVLLRVIIWKT